MKKNEFVQEQAVKNVVAAQVRGIIASSET